MALEVERQLNKQKELQKLSHDLKQQQHINKVQQKVLQQTYRQNQIDPAYFDQFGTSAR